MRHSNVSKCNLFVCMCTSFSIYREIVHWNALEQWLSSEKQRVPNSSTFETAFALTEKGKQWKLLVVSFFFMCFFRFCILNWFAASSNSSYKMLWCFLFNVCVNVCVVERSSFIPYCTVLNGLLFCLPYMQPKLKWKESNNSSQKKPNVKNSKCDKRKPFEAFRLTASSKSIVRACIKPTTLLKNALLITDVLNLHLNELELLIVVVYVFRCCCCCCTSSSFDLSKCAVFIPLFIMVQVLWKWWQWECVHVWFSPCIFCSVRIHMDMHILLRNIQPKLMFNEFH